VRKCQLGCLPGRAGLSSFQNFLWSVTKLIPDQAKQRFESGRQAILEKLLAMVRVYSSHTGCARLVNLPTRPFVGVVELRPALLVSPRGRSVHSKGSGRAQHGRRITRGIEPGPKPGLGPYRPRKAASGVESARGESRCV